MISLDDLNKLDDKKFEKLVKTTLLLVIGKGVTPFSKGKDGAREATFSGKAEYPSKSENWDGNWIFQVKFSDISLGIEKARAQIKYTINTELVKLEDYGYISSSACENYIYITNVPFSGEAEKGLHDYISEKRKKFRIKNFHYWDGEKILALINSHPEIRETFFPVPGLNIVNESTIIELNKYFVNPSQYNQLKEGLLTNKILNIVGQAHVGKTCMSLAIAAEIAEEKNLSNIYFVPLIDDLISIPKITDSIIIFDDLYGDVNYDTIGRKTKIINTLNRQNYVIITSRDYIFKEAERNSETFHSNGISITISQEGAFTDSQLEQILKNHLAINLGFQKSSETAYNYILTNAQYIVRQLRYPHNIQLFTSLVDNHTVTKDSLSEKITRAKKIEEVIQSWVIPQTELNKNILLALSIGKIQSLNILAEICKLQWDYSQNDVEKCLLENSRILTVNILLIRFIHPSFKTAITNLFLNKEKKSISDLLVNLISHPHYNEKRLINKSLAYSIIGDLNTEQLILLIRNKHVTKNFEEVCWNYLLKLSREDTLSLFLNLEKDKKGYSRHFSSLVSAKDFMKDKEIYDFVIFLLSRRQTSKVVEQLIVHFSFRLKSKIRLLINELDPNKNSRDLKLKIRLLGVIGSESPDSVIAELESELSSKFKSTRSIVYSAINMLSYKSNSDILDLLNRALKVETNRDNILKINKAIRHRTRR